LSLNGLGSKAVDLPYDVRDSFIQDWLMLWQRLDFKLLLILGLVLAKGVFLRHPKLAAA